MIQCPSSAFTAFRIMQVWCEGDLASSPFAFNPLLLFLEATVVLMTSPAISHLSNLPLALYIYFKANF